MFKSVITVLVLQLLSWLIASLHVALAEKSQNSLSWLNEKLACLWLAEQLMVWLSLLEYEQPDGRVKFNEL